MKNLTEMNLMELKELRNKVDLLLDNYEDSCGLLRRNFTATGASVGVVIAESLSPLT